MPFIMVLGKGVHMEELRIDGRLVYAINHKPSKAGHAKTEEYIDSQGRLDALFRKLLSGGIGADASSPT